MALAFSSSPFTDDPAAAFSPEALRAVLETLAPGARFLVAFSGGLDSSVLLHALCRLKQRPPLSAIHVNHQLYEQSDAWAAHCRQACLELDVKLASVSVDARPVAGQSPEERARGLRYRLLAGRLEPGDVLLTAHHRDDQTETVLLQLCRGGGPAGLAGMPAVRSLGAGRHARPLLAWPRAALHDWAVANDLRWIEDESNADVAFDRNFIRHQVLPELMQRWPGIAATLDRAARHQAAAAALLEEIAQGDLAAHGEAASASLPIAALADLSPERRRNLVRYWIRSLDLPLPDTKHLDRIFDEVLAARPDGEPCVSWRGAQVRRHRDRLVAMGPLPPHAVDTVENWPLNEPLDLGHGRLEARRVRGRGIRTSAVSIDGVEVRFRDGGERLRLPGRAHHTPLKELLRSAGIPAWYRDRVPLLFVGKRLAAVAGLWIDADFTAERDEEGWEITWTGLDEIAELRKQAT